MKKYLFEMFFIFLLPISLIAVIAEYSLRKIPDDYAYKNQWLTRNSHDVEVLALGASSVLFDINPLYLQKKGFNAAHVSQSMKFDHFIFNKFIDRMPSLEYLIISIDYWSIFGELEKTNEWWRVKYYNIYYGSNFHRWEGKYNYELYFRDIGTFKRATHGFLTLLGLKDETRITIDDKGYGIHYTLDNRKAEWDNGKHEASYHNDLIATRSDDKRVNQNRKYLEEIIQKCAEKNVKVILINVPLYVSYRDNLNTKFLKQQKDFCHYFTENHENVMFYDFSCDPRFTEDDYYDVTHLNERGAEKFTVLIDSVMHPGSSRLLTEHKTNLTK